MAWQACSVLPIDMNIWIGNRQSQARQTDSLVMSQIEAKYPGIATIISQVLFFVVKSRQFRLSIHSFDGVVYSFHKIYSKPNEVVLIL